MCMLCMMRCHQLLSELVLMPLWPLRPDLVPFVGLLLAMGVPGPPKL